MTDRFDSTDRPAAHHRDDSVGAPPDADLDAELRATDGLFAAAFAQLGDLPADLEQRARLGASATLMDRSLLGIAVDLMTVGVDTLRLLARDAPGGSKP